MSQILPVLLPGIVINFIIDIISATKALEEFLLEASSVVLDPEYIFTDLDLISGFNDDSIWLFSKFSIFYILKFHLNMDSKIFL